MGRSLSALVAAAILLSVVTVSQGVSTSAGKSVLPSQVCVSYGANPVLNSSEPYPWHFTTGGVTYNYTSYATTPSLVGLPTTMLEVATAGSVVAAAALVALVVLRLAARRQP